LCWRVKNGILGRLTRPNKADAGRIPKGKEKAEKNKNTKTGKGQEGVNYKFSYQA
jgi:hypothetical protein